MKLTEGEFSHVPAQPHTGLLGILIKHREQLEPGNKITGNAAVQTMALSRAIIEALGGKQIDGRWEVEIGGGSQDVEAPARAIISQLDEAQASLEDKYDEKVKALESRVAELEQDFKPGCRIDKISALVNANLTICGERGPLADRVDRLEQVFAGANQATPFIPATVGTIDIRDTPAIVELRTMIENLERAVAAQSPRKRSTAKAEEKPSEPQGE